MRTETELLKQVHGEADEVVEGELQWHYLLLGDKCLS